MTAAAGDHDPLYDPDQVVTLRAPLIVTVRRDYTPPTNEHVVAVATGALPEPNPPPRPLKYFNGQPRHRRAPRFDGTILGTRAFAAVLFACCVYGLAHFAALMWTTDDLGVKGRVFSVLLSAALVLALVWALLKLVTIHRCCDNGYTNGRP